MITALISTSPAAAVARRSMDRQRSSARRPAAIRRSDSLRRPTTNTAPKQAMIRKLT
jgi:hypothetical protein